MGRGWYCGHDRLLRQPSHLQAMDSARTYHICGCDRFTRWYFGEKGMDIGEDEEVPKSGLGCRLSAWMNDAKPQNKHFPS